MVRDSDSGSPTIWEPSLSVLTVANDNPNFQIRKIFSIIPVISSYIPPSRVVCLFSFLSFFLSLPLSSSPSLSLSFFLSPTLSLSLPLSVSPSLFLSPCLSLSLSPSLFLFLPSLLPLVCLFSIEKTLYPSENM